MKISCGVVAVLGALACGTLPALADARDDVLVNTARCGRIADPRAWLDCYYGAAQPMREQLGLSPAPAAQTRLVPSGPDAYAAPAPAAPAMAGPMAPAMAAAPQRAAPLPAREKSGGLMASLFGGKVIVNKMRATAYDLDAKGIFTITLTDGEVWEQLSDDDSHPTWRGSASRLVVTIKEGSLGSHNLLVGGDNRLYKVRRIR